MKIGKYEILIRKRKKFIVKFLSKTALSKWILKNIKMNNTEKIIILPNEIEVYEVYG